MKLKRFLTVLVLLALPVLFLAIKPPRDPVRPISGQQAPAVEPALPTPPGSHAVLGHASKEDPGFHGMQAAVKEGVGCIPGIYNKYAGRERDQAMTAAISYLRKSGPGAGNLELVEAIGKLPAGLLKEKWFRQAFHSFPRTKYPANELMTLLRKLDLPEDKRSFCLALIPNITIGTARELEEIGDLLGSDEAGLKKDLKKCLLADAANIFAGRVVQDGLWRGPEVWAGLSPPALNTAVRTVAGGLGARQEPDLDLFLSNVPKESVLTAVQAALEAAGEEKPSWGRSVIEGLPLDWQAEAVRGFVQGWVHRDPEAASVWARGLQVDALKSAAALAIVSYLHDTGGRKEEITAWEALLGK